MSSEHEARLFAFFNEVAIIDQLATARTERLLPSGMTLAQFGILNHFVRLGGEYSPARLARTFQVTKQTMTSTLARLERARLVAVRPDPGDGRGKLISLTDAGRLMHARCRSAMQPAMHEAAGLIAEGELDVLLPLVAGIRNRLDKARD